MNRPTRTILFVLVVLAAALLVERGYRAGGADVHQAGDEDGKGKIHIVDGYKAVQLDSDMIGIAGIKYETLAVMTFMPEFSAYAESVDITPLVKFKTGYTDLLAAKSVLQNELANKNKILQRAENLHKIKSLSTRELEKNRADRDVKRAQLSELNTRLENYAYEVKSRWGIIIGSIALDREKQSEFDRLAMHTRTLILVSLMKNRTLNDPGQKVFVSSINRRNSAWPVTYLDQAYRSTNPLYGESYFYTLDSRMFPAGMRLFAWIEEGDEVETGLFIPASAVIWYTDEPWIYVKHKDDIFVRRPLVNAIKLDDGWFIKEGLIDADVLVVTVGGQMLLSEEFKWAIPNEDDD